MNSSEKLEQILLRLYYHHKDRNISTPILREIMRDLNIYEHDKEDKLMVDSLSPYADIKDIKGGINIRLNEAGISYVEENLLP